MEKLKINETILFYRKKLGLTQEELAKKLNVSNQTISKWELAQCCPDISLLPTLADIFNISIDELFKRESKRINNELPWEDDKTYRIFIAVGKKILQSTDDRNNWINVSFPKDCNDTTRQYFKVEVLGNICCDASINGDVIAHKNITCNDINGDIIKCDGNIECHEVNGSIACQGNIIYK